MDAVSQEKIARVVWTTNGDAALTGGLHQGGFGRLRTEPLGQFAQAGETAFHIEVPIVYSGQAQIASGFQSRAAETFVLEFESHFVNAHLVGFARTAKANGGAGQRLKLQSDVLQDMGQPGATTEPLEKTTAPADAATVLD
jgi:hypothetical protein